MNVERIAVPNEELDAAERAVRAALADIEADYRRDAEPWLKRLTDIQSRRQYRYIIMPEQTPTQTGTADENIWDYGYVFKWVKPRDEST